MQVESENGQGEQDGKGAPRLAKPLNSCSSSVYLAGLARESCHCRRSIQVGIGAEPERLLK